MLIRGKDEEKYNGDHRTKRVILEIYDHMAGAIHAAIPYKTRLDRPLAHPGRCHSPEEATNA